MSRNGHSFLKRCTVCNMKMVHLYHVLCSHLFPFVCSCLCLYMGFKFKLYFCVIVLSLNGILLCMIE